VKPFAFRQADTPWPIGATLLHVYLLVDPDRDADLIRLVEAGQAAVADFPISPVPRRWLHLTVDQVTDGPAAEIPPAERDALIAELRTRTAAVQPFDVAIGSMLSYHSGVIADVHPDGDLAALYETVHDGIRAVRGETAVRYPYTVPHLTVGYAHGEADSDEIQRLLRRVRPSHATLHIDAIHLVDVAASSGPVRGITWEPVATIQLGTGTATVTSTHRQRSSQPVSLPADVMRPVGADETATAVHLVQLAGTAVVAAQLGLPVSATRPHGPGGSVFAEVVLGEEISDPDAAGVVAWAPVAAANRYLELIGQANPQNLATVLDARMPVLEFARQRAVKPWDDLRTEADRLVEAHWVRIVGLARQLADDAGMHGPVGVEPG
jgi:2'-5' RNA ligase